MSTPHAGQVLPAEASWAARGQAVGKGRPASCCEVILLKEILDRSCKGVANCPGLIQAAHQCLSCSPTLCRAAGQELQDGHSPLPRMARGNGGDSSSVHALFPRKGIKRALTKFTLPSVFLGE